MPFFFTPPFDQGPRNSRQIGTRIARQVVRIHRAAHGQVMVSEVRGPADALACSPPGRIYCPRGGPARQRRHLGAVFDQLAASPPLRPSRRSGPARRSPPCVRAACPDCTGSSCPAMCRFSSGPRVTARTTCGGSPMDLSRRARGLRTPVAGAVSLAAPPLAAPTQEVMEKGLPDVGCVGAAD